MLLSKRSARAMSISIPFSKTGRIPSKIFSPPSVYNARVANPLPVETRHSASDNQGFTEEMLSNPRHQELPAEIARSRGLVGAARSGAPFGSMTERSTLDAVLFAL